MKVKFYETRNCWRVIVPGRLTDTGKDQARYFKTKEEGEAEVRRILGRGTSAKPQLNNRQSAILSLAETEGLNLEEIQAAFRHYRATVLNVSKRAHLFELVEKFLERQVHERRAPRTLDDDRQRLSKLCAAFENIDVCRLTEPGFGPVLDYFPPWPQRR